MSQYSEIMDAFAAQGEKLDWCVAALRHLLLAKAGVDEGDLALDADFEPQNLEPLAPLAAVPRAPKAAPACPHNQQSLVNGAVVCGRCGKVLVQGGIINDPSRNGNAAAQTEWGRNSLMESNPG